MRLALLFEGFFHALFLLTENLISHSVFASLKQCDTIWSSEGGLHSLSSRLWAFSNAHVGRADEFAGVHGDGREGGRADGC